MFIFPSSFNLSINPWVTPAQSALKAVAFSVYELKTSFKHFSKLNPFAANDTATFEDKNPKVDVAMLDNTTLFATPSDLTKTPEKHPTEIADTAIPITAKAVPEIDSRSQY